MRSNCVSVWCCSMELKYAATRFLAPRQMFYVPAQFVDRGSSSPSLLFVQSPGRGTRPKCKKHEETTALKKKTRNAPSAFSNAGGIVKWHPLKLCCYNEKNSTIQRHRGARSLVAACRTKTISVNIGVISMFSRITSDKHVQLKNVRCHGTVSFFLEPKQKGRDARSCGTRAHDDGRSFDIDKRHCTAVSAVVRRVSRQGLLRPSVRSLRRVVHLGSRPSSLTTFCLRLPSLISRSSFRRVFVAVQETQTVSVVCCTAAHLLPTHTNLWPLS